MAPLSLTFILQTQYCAFCSLSSMIFISDPVTLVVYLLHRSFVDVYKLLLKQCQFGFQVIFINFDQRTGLQSACAVATNLLFFSVTKIEEGHRVRLPISGIYHWATPISLGLFGFSAVTAEKSGDVR